MKLSARNKLSGTVTEIAPAPQGSGNSKRLQIPKAASSSNSSPVTGKPICAAL